MLGLWITLAVLLALAIFLWRLRLGLYVVFGRGQAAADLTIGPFRVRLVPVSYTHLHTAHDIVCYESGRDFTYGEGTEADEHTAEEAEAHTVVHITQPGTYALSGTRCV